MENDKKKFTIKKILAIIGGMLLFVFGLVFVSSYIDTQRLMNKVTVETDGKVISVYVRTDDEGDRSYETTVEYMIDGKKYSRRNTISTEHDINDIMTVRYDPENPENAYIPELDDSPGQNIGYAVMFFAAGVALIIWAAVKL